MTTRNEPLRAAVLGATGTVGQRFVTLLAGHPWFELTAVAASERSAGKLYRDAATWIQTRPIDDAVAAMPVRTIDELADRDFDIVSLRPSTPAWRETSSPGSPAAAWWSPTPAPTAWTRTSR